MIGKGFGLMWWRMIFNSVSLDQEIPYNGVRDSLR